MARGFLDHTGREGMVTHSDHANGLVPSGLNWQGGSDQRLLHAVHAATHGARWAKGSGSFAPRSFPTRMLALVMGSDVRSHAAADAVCLYGLNA
jgi:hypothetical protein